MNGLIFLNALDIGIIALVAIFAIVGYRKGLIRTVYRLVAFVLAVFIARQLYPYVARFLRGTALFPTIKEGIANAMNLQGFFNDHIQSATVIDQLPLPEALRNILHTNNTPDMFEILQVATVEEYVAGFFANMVTNGIAMVAVFLLTWLVLVIVGNLLDIVSMLPVIRTLNNVGGLLFGVAISAILVWVGLVVVALFAIGSHPQVFILLEESAIAQRIFEATLPQLTNVQ